MTTITYEQFVAEFPKTPITEDRFNEDPEMFARGCRFDHTEVDAILCEDCDALCHYSEPTEAWGAKQAVAMIRCEGTAQSCPRVTRWLEEQA